jgi:hypothetical protein
MPKRGDRVAPPARPGEWELRHQGTSADGWDKLCDNTPSAALACYEALAAKPTQLSGRQKRLRGDLDTRTIGGKPLEQWQYEVTAGGRVFYCPDPNRRIVWLTEVHLTSPKKTHRKG